MTHVWDEIEFRNQGVKFLLYAQEIVHGLIHKDKVEHLDSSPVAPQSPDIWDKNFWESKLPLHQSYGLIPISWSELKRGGRRKCAATIHMGSLKIKQHKRKSNTKAVGLLFLSESNYTMINRRKQGFHPDKLM